MTSVGHGGGGGHSSAGHSSAHSAAHGSVSTHSIPFSGVHGSVPAQQANVSSEQQIEQHVHKWPSWVGGTVFCLMLVLILVLLYNVLFGDWEKGNDNATH